MDARTFRVLVFDKIRERLAEHTSFSLGRERALALLPADDIRQAVVWQAETREARRLLDEKSDVHLGGVHDLRPLVEQASIGSTLTPMDLLTVRSTLVRARTLSRMLGRLDPAMTHRYEGAESGVGAITGWSGNRKAGEGRMEIIEAAAPLSVTVDLQFLKPWKAQNTTTFTLTPDAEGTDIVWSMTGPLNLVMKVMGIFKSMDKMIGPDFEEGLANLKAVAERGPGVVPSAEEPAPSANLGGS